MNSAFGVAPPISTITVNEFGTGTYNGVPLVSGLEPDPFNGGALHLAYTLPFVAAPSVPFDIVLLEPGGSQPSDLLRFLPGSLPPGQPSVSPTATLLFFYSDATDGADSPADIAVIPNPIGGPLIFPETGLFGNPYSEAGPNGLVYTAGIGANGSDGNPAGTQYTFISDVPEPGTVTLVSLSFAGLLLVIRRRK